jgi:DNA-binding transcriptional LysR family regulator
MELRQLEYLITVIDEGTFTAAATRLRIAQSAVSHHVSKLERELGVQLLRRERPKVLPTPLGEVFAARARRILAEVSAATEDLSGLQGQTVGAVTFGATIPAASFDVAGLIGAFRAGYPGVRVRLREGTRSELLDMVRDDRLDVAVVSAKPDDLPKGITRMLVDIDHLVLAGPHGHPLERYDVVPVQELHGADLVTFREGAGLRRAADEVLEQVGVKPNVVIESNEMAVLVGLVSEGLGLAILPRAFVAQSTKPVWSRPLDPPIDPPLTLIWREGRRRSSPADVFLRHVIQFASAQRQLQPES